MQAFRRRFLIFLAACAALATPDLALPSPTVGSPAIDELARAVERAEAVRAVKNLQRTYAQYAQFGLWEDMADLFEVDATLLVDDEAVHGRQAIATYLTDSLGHGHRGLLPGAVNTQLIDEPEVNLSVDGQSAEGRWYGLFLMADGQGNATMQGGVFENAYSRQNGIWRISSLNFHPQYAGTYETGWSNWRGRDLPIIAFHFDADQSGVPIPTPVGPAPESKESLARLERRIASLNAEDEVRNLQAAYGYYVNRRMWDDVGDLFARDGVYEVGGIGVYVGPRGVRKALQRMGPAGLTHGILNDHLQFDTVVTIAPGGHEAHARGIELGLLGAADRNEAYWEINVYDNRFVKEHGLWKVREMRVFPVLRSEYGLGWGRSRIQEPVPTGTLAPDRAVPKVDVGAADKLIPSFHAANPVTGRPPVAPDRQRFVAATPLTTAIAAATIRVAPPDPLLRLADDLRRLSRSTAYDGAENVSTTYGEYADDFQWPQMAAIFGKRGAKQIPFAGYYSGADRIAHALNLEYGDSRSTRSGIAFHWRIQPVINVSEDGRSARLRTYLFHPDTSKQHGALFGAIYPDDHLILEDGVWRLWNLSLDEPYFSMTDWKGGWSAAKDHPEPGPRPTSPPAGPGAAAGTPPRPRRYIGAALVAEYAPDIPITVLGARQEHFRGGTGTPWEWPMILPMWWGYKNPVTGRTPELFLPDCVPCDYDPDQSMTRHGYFLPVMNPRPSDD